MSWSRSQILSDQFVGKPWKIAPVDTPKMRVNGDRPCVTATQTLYGVSIDKSARTVYICNMTKIDRIRKIVTDRQRAKVEGTMVDLFTANAIITVHDHLSPENQAKFLAQPLAKMASIAFRLVK